jgi:hypothetical protein
VALSPLMPMLQISSEPVPVLLTVMFCAAETDPTMGTLSHKYIFVVKKRYSNIDYFDFLIA